MKPSMRARLFFLAVFCAASPLVVFPAESPTAPRVLQVKAVADEAFRENKNWEKEIREHFEWCDQEYRRFAQIGLQLVAIDRWTTYESKDMGLLLEELRHKVEKGDADIVVGFTGHQPPAFTLYQDMGVPDWQNPDIGTSTVRIVLPHMLGIALPFADRVVVRRSEEKKETRHTLLHEIAHLFGGLHVREKSLLYTVAGRQDFVLDSFNQRVLALTHDRDFNLDVHELPRETLEQLITLYRQRPLRDERDFENNVRVGYLLIAQGEVDAAIEEFEEAIKIDPSSTYSIIRSAIIPELEAHAEEHGSTLLTRYTLGRAYSTIREYSKAADILSENCYASDPHAPSCSEMGVMLMQQGAISEAEEVLQRALELDEALVHAHNNLGIVYSVQGRTSDAVRHLNRALELRPNESRVHYNMGMAYLNMELAEPAANSFRRALELDPKDEEARSKLALAYLRQGNLKEAREIVRELEKEKQRVDLGFITLEMTRLTPQIYRDMAEIYFRSGDAKKAWKYLGEAKKRGFNVTELEQEMLAGTAQPRRVKTADLVEQAAAYYAKQRYDLARNLLEQARSQDASKHQTHYWLGRVARAEDKPEEAAQHLQEAIRLKEKFPDAHLELGRLAYDQENYGVAIGHLDRYLELESYPRNDAYYILGTCHYHQNQLVAAETNLKKAIRGNSDYGDAFYLLAAVYNKQERKEDAIRELNLAVGSRSLSSSFRSEAHYNLAVLYHETGKEQEALKHARIAQRLGYADVGQLLGELAKVIPEADEEIIDSLPEYAAPPQSRSASVGQYEIGEARIGNPPGMARSGQLILGRVRLLRSPEATEQIVLSIKIRSASSRQWQGWMFAYAQVDEEGEGGEAVFGFMLPPSLPQEGEFRCALAVVSDPRAGRLPPPTLSNELEVSFRLVPDTSTSPTLKRRATPQP